MSSMTPNTLSIIKIISTDEEKCKVIFLLLYEIDNKFKKFISKTLSKKYLR